MAKHYSIADIHGRYDLFQKAIAKIMVHSADEPYTLVITGDFVDRGPESQKLVDALIRGPIDDRSKWVILRGNHEDMMLTCLKGHAHLGWWISNGGGETLESYGYKDGDPIRPLKGKLPMHMAWLSGLPYIYEDNHRVYVHAGIDKKKDIAAQDEKIITWMLYRNHDEGFTKEGKHIVHGHHQFKDGPKFYKGRTNLDAFAWATGRLVIGVFDDEKEGGPVEILEVRGSPHVRYHVLSESE